MTAKDGFTGEGHIGWVEVSRTGRSFVYRGRRLLRVRNGYKYNCIDEETQQPYWVSGPRRDGADRLYGGLVHVDDDAREAYWTTIRGRPDAVTRATYVAPRRRR